MQDFSPGDFGTTLQCFHIFHTVCAHRWLEQSGNCPVCRVQAYTPQTPGNVLESALTPTSTDRRPFGA
jgi:hypothetical protein